ncbi:uncharacterized protein LOC126678955 [Mercurialis annua]|uniref:uncharacterized protein LOC126678955 n=1 Tax=Mercurialis annua TaxID=3986 RepID=UPI002160C202|nr:uncharacterized protein LOC126678955 [Mercurialis annua]
MASTSISMATNSVRTYSSCNYISNPKNNSFFAITASTRSFNLRLVPRRTVLKHVFKPLSAVSSGLETTIPDAKDNAIILKKAQVVVESAEENKIQLRVDLPGDETEKVFGKVLADLARSAPPVPGFRREKGGKTSKVPREFLLQILGEERVTNFVIQEIVSSSVADYVKKENLKVKENKVTTIQEAEELKKLFTPGNDFGFNAVLELEETESDSDTETDSESETESESETKTET